MKRIFLYNTKDYSWSVPVFWTFSIVFVGFGPNKPGLSDASQHHKCNIWLSNSTNNYYFNPLKLQLTYFPSLSTKTKKCFLFLYFDCIFLPFFRFEQIWNALVLSQFEFNAKTFLFFVTCYSVDGRCHFNWIIAGVSTIITLSTYIWTHLMAW